jgi:hypothetical protein
MARRRSQAERSLRGDVEQVARVARGALARDPILAVGMAAGLGFALGGGLSRQMLIALAGMGARTAANFAASGVLSRTQSARAQSEGGDDDTL